MWACVHVLLAVSMWTEGWFCNGAEEKEPQWQVQRCTESHWLQQMAGFSSVVWMRSLGQLMFWDRSMKTSIWPCWQGAPMATVWEFSTYTYHTDCQLSAHPHNDRLSPIQYTPAYNTVNIYFSFCFVKDLDKSQAGFTTLTKKEDGLKFFILFLPLKMSSVNVARNRLANSVCCGLWWANSGWTFGLFILHVQHNSNLPICHSCTLVGICSLVLVSQPLEPQQSFTDSRKFWGIWDGNGKCTMGWMWKKSHLRSCHKYTIWSSGKIQLTTKHLLIHSFSVTTLSRSE